MINKTLKAAALVAGALAFVAGDAFAHGGQFRGPSGRLPPGLRDPFDAPPILPPSSPTTPGTPITPGPVTPGPSTPLPPTTTGPASTPAPGPNTRLPTGGKKSGLTPGDWTFWFGYNSDAILNLKSRIYAHAGTNHPITILGRGGSDARASTTHDIRGLVETDLLPAMRWAMDPSHKLDSDIESAAYIGLAKVARMPSQIEEIMRPLKSPKDYRAITIESAAMSLGLLRRSDEDEQFEAVELDRVRAFLFETLDNDKLHIRARAFAAMSLGLLGDQPTAQATETNMVAQATQTTAALFERLGGQYASTDIPIAVLSAIGLQSRDSLTAAHRTTLQSMALSGRLDRKSISTTVQAHAVQALSRVGNERAIGILQRLLVGSRVERRIQRSAAIGIGRLAANMGTQQRIDVTKDLIKWLGRSRDNSTEHFALISMSDLIATGLRGEEASVLEETRVGAFLLEQATKGSAESQAYAALSLGLSLRAMGEKVSTQDQYEFRKAALDALRTGLKKAKGGPHTQAAFAAALGIAADSKSIPALREIVDDSKLASEFRGYAAIGIGLMGAAPKVALVSIRSALREHRSEEMRVQCATALGLLSDAEAVPILLEQLKTARTQSLKGQLVVALARIGNHKAVRPMIALLKNGSEQILTRALACAGLGVVGDMELMPSLSLISEDLNFRAPTDALLEWTSVL